MFNRIIPLLRYLYLWIWKYGIDLRTIVITILGTEKAYQKITDTGYELVSSSDDRFKPFEDTIIRDMGGRYGR